MPYKQDYTDEQKEAMIKLRTDVGRQVRFYRKQVHKMSVEELATRSGVSPRNIRHVEEGSHSVTIDRLVLICNAMKLQIKITI